jgi:hypothetical protein
VALRPRAARDVERNVIPRGYIGAGCGGFFGSEDKIREGIESHRYLEEFKDNFEIP